MLVLVLHKLNLGLGNAISFSATTRERSTLPLRNELKHQSPSYTEKYLVSPMGRVMILGPRMIDGWRQWRIRPCVVSVRILVIQDISSICLFATCLSSRRNERSCSTGSYLSYRQRCDV